MLKGLASLAASGANRHSEDPTRVICRDAKIELSISVFDKLSNDIAAILSSYLNSPVVGVSLRSTCLIPIVLVGILKAGKAFCCLNDLSDGELVGSCFVSHVIADDEKELSATIFYEIKELVINELSGFGRLYIGQVAHRNASPSFLGTALDRGEIAYVAFTSGSTGKPKPVFVTHSSIVPNILDFNKLWDISQNDTIALMSPLTFDPSFVEIFCSLSSGAVLYVVSPEKRLNASILVNCLLENGVTIVQMTPSMFSLFSQSDLQLLLHSPRSKLRVIAFGGEHFPFNNASLLPTVLREWLQQGKAKKMSNLYGVTEVSCWGAISEIDYESLTSIAAFPDVGFAMSDSALLPVLPTTKLPSFRIRELAISTRCRRCYVGSELLSSAADTSESFVRRTGDLVVPLKTGGFRIVGRVDDFIKRFGQKVNVHMLEESVLKFLKEHAHRVVVVVNKQGRAKLNLCVFLTSEGQAHPSAVDVQSFIRSALGHVYVPDQIHFTSLSVPLTRHGKISRMVVKSFFEYVRPADVFKRPLVKLFADLWFETTGKVPSVSSRFVEDGGDSIAVIRICENIRQAAPHASLLKLADLLLTKSFNEVEVYLKGEATTSEPVISTNITALPTNQVHITTTFGVVARAAATSGRVPELLHLRNSNVKNCLLEMKWKSYLEKCIDGSPLVKISLSGSSRIYIASHSGLVRCLNGEDGKVVWDFRVNGRVEGSLVLSACGSYVIFGAYNNSISVVKEGSGDLHFKTTTGDIVKSTPAVDYNGTGSVYVGCHDGALYVIDPANGVLVGKIDCKSGAILATPLICPTSVLVCTLQGKVLCFDKTSFETKWKFDLESPIFSTPTTVPGDIVVIAAVNGDVLALNNGNGETIWRLNKVAGNIFAPLTNFDDNFVLIASHSGKAGSLVCLNCQSGTTKWITETPAPITGAPFVAKGVAFVYDTKGTCHILLTINGSFVSSSPLQLPGDVFSSPVVFNDHLFIGCRDDYLYCLKIDFEYY